METELTKQVEAVLYASGKFVDSTHIAEVVGSSQKKVLEACKALQERYSESNSALRVLEEEGAWKLHIQDTYLELVSKMVKDTEVSGPVLETLAVIAWRSPIMQAEVIDIRGTNAYEHVKELVENNFIKKEPSGRTFQLRVTDKFFEYFDIEGRDDIRAVFKRVEEQHREKEMEMELAQKRLEEAIEKAEGEEEDGEEVVSPEKPAIPLSDKKVSLDDLDAVLEKSRQTREKIAGDMQRMRPEEEEKEEESDGISEENIAREPEGSDGISEENDGSEPEKTVSEEPEDDHEVSLEEAQKVRKKAEKDMEDME